MNSKEDFEEEMMAVRSQTTEDGYIRCDVNGAEIVRRPTFGNTIKSVVSTVELLDEAKVVEVDDPMDVEMEELIKKGSGFERDGSELEFMYYYEMALETPHGKEFILTISLDENTSIVSIHDLENVSYAIDSVYLKMCDENTNKCQLQFGETKIDSIGMIGKSENYEYEWNQLCEMDTNFKPITELHLFDGWVETTPKISVDDERVILTVDYVGSVKWEFESPISWTTENEYVSIVEEFAFGNLSELENSDVYIKYSEKGVSSKAAQSEDSYWWIALKRESVGLELSTESEENPEEDISPEPDNEEESAGLLARILGFLYIN